MKYRHLLFPFGCRKVRCGSAGGGGWALFVAAVLAPALATGEEPVRSFLDGLRERGYYDTAVDYLDHAPTSPLVTAEVKEILLYERGRTLIEGSNSQRDFQLREKQLDQALASLQDFIQQKAQHKLVPSAKRELGNLLVQRAAMKVDKGSRPQFAAQRENLLKESKLHYAEALKIFEEAKSELRKKLESDAYKNLNPEKKEDAPKITERDEYRQEYLQTRLVLASIMEESANASGETSTEGKDLLTKAAKEYKDISEDYRRLLAGMYARMYEGRCYLKLGDLKQALTAFGELASQDEKEPAFRKLKTRALALALDAWSKDPKTVEEGIKQGMALLANIRPTEAKDIDMLECRYQLGVLLKMRADLDPNKNRADYAQARTVLTPAVKNPHPKQKQAESLLASLPGGGTQSKRGDPRNFAEAVQFGQEAMGDYQTATVQTRELPEQIKAAKEATAKEELKKKLAEAEKEAVDAREEAFLAYRKALEFANKQTDLAEVNKAQYFLCYLLYVRGDIHQAAVAGEFVARHFRESTGARSCALMALAAYQKMYVENKDAEDKGAFESARVVSMAEYITRQWPDQPEAIEAFGTLVPFLVKLNRLDDAVAAIKMIPVESPGRGRAELIIGQALWSNYLLGMRDMRKWEKEGSPPGTNPAAETTRLNDLKARATATLVAGIERMEKAGGGDPSLASAAFSLAQVYVETNDYAKAVALLGNETYGPLSLVRKKDPVVSSRPNFAGEAIQLALRAQIGTLQGKTGAEAEKIIAAAKGLMDELQKTVGAEEGGEAKIMGVYVSLARNLNEQMKIATAEEKKALALGFQTFLRAAADQSTDHKTLHWAAETFFTLGESNADDKATAADAQGYFEQSLKYYGSILDLAAKKTIDLDPKMQTFLTMRKAVALRKMGRFKEALEIYENLLKPNPMQLTFQLEAARALMEQGDAGDEKGYEQAIMGITPRGGKAKTVWGWYTMANLTGRKPEFAEYFHEARFGWAKALYGRAMLVKETEKKKEMLASSRKAVEAVAKVYPNLGGEKWFAEYDDLLKKIQKATGDKVIGVKALNLPEPGEAPAAAPAANAAAAS